MYRNLKFFDKKGYPLRFVYDSSNDKWVGNLYFTTTSVGLIENINFHILESVYLNGEENATLKMPTIQIGQNDWYAAFDKYVSRESEIFLYSFVKDTDGNNYINIETSKDLNLPQFNITYNEDESKKIVNTGSSILQTSPLTINVAFQPTIEDPLTRVLKIKEKNTDKVIIEISIYGDGEDEDERMKDLLYNIGHDILPEDSIIFNSSNPKEEFTDWKLLNQKRKELLLEHSNLFPYTGSYKALINVLKFYGYKNIKLKEYWKNIDSTSRDFGKYKQIDIKDLFIENADLETQDSINSKIYKKTNNISLYYDITVPNGEFDTEGLPYTEEVFSFTQEEILIKLYALKKKLQFYYLPLNTRIIDIIGEAIYFGLYNVAFMTSQNRIDDIQIGKSPVFEVYPTKNFYINDLSYLGDIASDGVLTPTQIQQVLNDETSNTLDLEGVQVGCPVVFTNKTFNLTFDDLKIAYNQLLGFGASGSTGMYNNWENLNSFEQLEIKWNIDLVENEKTYSFEKIIPITETLSYNNLFGIILPYTGWYSVKLTITDAYNNSTFLFKNKIIEVKSYEVDFIGWYTKIDKEYNFNILTNYDRQTNLTSLSESNLFDEELNWFNYTAKWEKPLHPNEPVSIADLSYESLNSVNFYQNLENEITDKNIGYFDFKYNSVDSDIQWKELYHLDWDSSGSRVIQWRLSDFIDDTSNYFKLNITSKGITDSVEYPYPNTGKSSYLNILNLLKGSTSIFNEFSYFFVENSNDQKLDIYAYSKTFDTPGRYLLEYKSSVGGASIYTRPYFINYAGLVGETPGHFEIYDVVPNAPIQITILYNTEYNPIFEYSLDYSSEGGSAYSYQSGFVYEHPGYNNFKEFYLDITSVTNEYAKIVFDNFSINPVYDKNLDLIKIQFIQKTQDYSRFEIYSNENIFTSNYQIRINKNINYDDIRVLKYNETFPSLMNIHFCYDNSKIPGKTNPLWVLSKNDDSLFDDIYYRNKYFSYTFSKKGSYSLSLYLEDTNGNSSIITKNEFIKII